MSQPNDGPRPHTPQIDNGYYILQDTAGREIAHLIVFGSSLTGTEWWFLFTQVPAGANAAPWPTPAQGNPNQTVKFVYKGAPTDPYVHRADLVNQGYQLNMVKSPSSLIP